MITEMIAEPLQNLLLQLINILPTLDLIQIPDGLLSWTANIIGGAGYFLPIVDFMVMFGIYLGIVNFHIVWRVIQRLWDALPLT